MSLKRLIPVFLLMTAFASVALAQQIFNDVPNGFWAADSIQWANTNGVMTGPGDQPGMFDPAGVVNRAQLATVSKRLYDVTHGETQNVADDVDGLQNTNEGFETRIAALENQVAQLQGNVQNFNATLEGQNEVPPVTTPAAGTATMTLNNDDLTYNITVQNLSSSMTGAHFHIGAAGENGSIAHTIIFTGNTASGVWNNLTADQLAYLRAGQIYVNVHTTNNPDGEIRGQVQLVSE